MSDFIPWGRALPRAGHFIGKTGSLPGIGSHLTQVARSLSGLGNAARDKLGMIAAQAVARARGMRPIGYIPRGNGGFDQVFKDKDGFIVFVE